MIRMEGQREWGAEKLGTKDGYRCGSKGRRTMEKVRFGEREPPKRMLAIEHIYFFSFFFL